MTVFVVTHKAITDALDRLATSDRIKKITAMDVVREAGISKASLYRYFEADKDLRRDYDAIRKSSVCGNSEAPGTLQEAFANAQAEIRELRQQLAEAEAAGTLKAQQVLLLWKENKALRRELKPNAASSPRPSNVSSLQDRNR